METKIRDKKNPYKLRKKIRNYWWSRPLIEPSVRKSIERHMHKMKEEIEYWVQLHIKESRISTKQEIQIVKTHIALMKVVKELEVIYDDK